MLTGSFSGRFQQVEGSQKMRLTARRARSIRRGCQRRSQHPNGLGVSELFLAPLVDAGVIVAAKDVRLKLYLLGFSRLPSAVQKVPPGRIRPATSAR